QKPPQDEWGKTQDTVGTFVFMEKNLYQASVDLNSLGSGPTDPHLCYFQERCFLEEHLKLIKKMGDTL
ncbi:hypothetical protein DBR06_SOUSAS29210004, partial [Sousa chinensis]